MAGLFEIGDLVWAKMKGFQPWPAKVIEPKPEVKRPADKKPKQFVLFFGTEDYAWVLEDQIWPYIQYRDKYKSAQRPSRTFLDAVETAEELVKNLPADKLLPRRMRSRSPSPAASTSSRGTKHSDAGDKTPSDRKSSPPSSSEKTKSAPGKSSSVKSESKLKSLTKTKKEHGSDVPRKKRLSEAPASAPPPTKTRLLGRHDDHTATSSYDFDDLSTPKSSSTLRLPGTSSTECERSVLGEQSFLPDVLPSLSDTFVAKNIIATPMKIGFLGLGLIGSGMVDNLLRSGHEVTIWNRTASKCREFVKDGALKGNSPAEVVQSCDITFSCVSDPSALRDLIFGNCGVLQGITHGKGYVDMSTVDVETITDVSEAVITRGGRFLEAPVIGSKQLAKDGQLVVIAAGDKTLYEDCHSCFQAMARHMFYIGETGCASKMKLVLNLLFGTTLAGLAESMALAEKIGLNTAEVLNILTHTAGSSAFLRAKGTEMALSRISDPSCKLQTLQKDLRLAINMSDSVDQPLHVGAAVNELFKKAKAKGYGEYDIAAVYRAADL